MQKIWLLVKIVINVLTTLTGAVLSELLGNSIEGLIGIGLLALFVGIINYF